MLDNYDSFTYNLVHYFQALGQEVLVRRNDQITLAQIATLAPEYIVISPGPGDPNSAGISLEVIEHFIGKIPILGVCLGHQCIAQHFGAKINKATKVMHAKKSVVYHDNHAIFTKINNPFSVIRYHSLIIEPSSLPKCLQVIAYTKQTDKESDEIMAIAHETLPIIGVQFHPESVLTEQGMQLLNNFISQYSASALNLNK